MDVEMDGSAREVAQGGKVVCWKTLRLSHLQEELLQVPPTLECSTKFLEESQHSSLLVASGENKVNVLADVVLIAVRSECGKQHASTFCSVE